MTFHRRVVVTGLGCVSCLGVNAKTSWTRLIAGRSGIAKLTSPGFSKIPVDAAGTIKVGTEEDCFDPSSVGRPSTVRNMSMSTLFGLKASEEALRDSGWDPSTEEEQNSTAVSIGSAISCTATISKTIVDFQSRGYNSVSPFFIPKTIINILAGHVSIRSKAKGPNISCSSAFATGGHSVGSAFRYIKQGMARVVVAGSAEAPVTPWIMSGFCRAKSLCPSQDCDPSQYSRPFDLSRRGFVIAEGAACLVLEELDHALRRNAKIYAEVVGFGTSSDSLSLTAPCPDGSGALRSMRRALVEAQVDPMAVGYVNAHATSTVLGDRAENKAIAGLFSPERTKVSSTKGSMGHALGAAGSLELVTTCLACFHGVVPPTLNLCTTEEGFDFDYVPNCAQDWTGPRRVAVKNSFGFGGANTSLCISNYLQ